MNNFFKDISLSAVVAGLVATLVGFTSTVVIVFQAATSFGATPEMVASWLWALGLGMGICTAFPSLWWRVPVMVAWSTPGAAVLVAAGATGHFSMQQAVGAFMVASVATIVVGTTGWFETLAKRVPVGIANALLAGILARFCLQAFKSLESSLMLVVLMLLVYLFSKKLIARYAVPLTFAAGVGFAAINGDIAGQSIQWGLATPVFVMPTFTIAAFLGLALPLWVVTMTSQNLPGVAVIRAFGYEKTQADQATGVIPVSKVLALTGWVTLALAPFGAFALNLSAITAAICMGPQAHKHPGKRYTAAVVCGAIYIAIGLCGAAFVALLAAFPKDLVMAIAGLALLGTVATSLATALEEPKDREAIIVTFLVTLSGVVIASIGSAFWGVVAGGLALAIGRWKKPA